jgi:hypothetical protein
VDAAPAPQAPPPAPKQAPKPAIAAASAPRPGPVTPSFVRRGAAACVNCGVVAAITSYPGLWDVRVRLEDGGGQTFRYRTLPPYRIGDRVRVDGAHLTFD